MSDGGYDFVVGELLRPADFHDLAAFDVTGEGPDHAAGHIVNVDGLKPIVSGTDNGRDGCNFGQCRHQLR